MSAEEQAIIEARKAAERMITLISATPQTMVDRGLVARLKVDLGLLVPVLADRKHYAALGEIDAAMLALAKSQSSGPKLQERLLRAVTSAKRALGS